MENKINIFNGKYILDIVVLICGAVVMIFELIGSRVISPYVGTSIYVWTSLIGVILASLSVGYYAGGYLADKNPSTRPLALIIIYSALAIVFSVLIKDNFSAAISNFQFDLELKTIIISLTLFAPASFLLGMVSPYAVRLRMIDLSKSGRTAGNLYAMSTFGSILGTFLAGFYIIPNFGSTNSLIIIASVLFLLGFLLLINKSSGKIAKILFFLFFIFLGLNYLWPIVKKQNLVADIDTAYNRIFIFYANDLLTKKPIIALATDPYGIQAAKFVDGPDDLVFGYTKFYRVFSHFVPNPENVLMIGGAVYTYPKYFMKHYPNTRMDVVEIDPGMTDVAKKYFGFEEQSNLDIYHQDGRIYLNNNKKKYDVIFVDAFNSAASIPFHLTTKEFITKEYESLNENGVVLVNIVSAIEGEKGKFARAEYATYKKVFPQVFLFSVKEEEGASNSQNLILVALKSKKVFEWQSADPEINKFFSQIWDKPILDDLPILIDDFAPVEHYMRSSL